MAALIREAIDVAFPSTSDDRRKAAGRLLRAEPMPVPDVPDLLTELDELRGRWA